MIFSVIGTLCTISKERIKGGNIHMPLLSNGVDRDTGEGGQLDNATKLNKAVLGWHYLVVRMELNQDTIRSH